MIRARFYGSSMAWEGFALEGHAGFEDSGRDVVCAAVSALAQAALGGILDVVEARADYQLCDNGALSIRLSDETDERKREDVHLLCEVLRQSLEGIEHDFGQYLKVSTD